MSEKKELNKEQLEKVSGGGRSRYHYYVVYKEQDSEEEKSQFLGDDLRALAETRAKEWCEQNNKRYVRYTSQAF